MYIKLPLLFAVASLFVGVAGAEPPAGANPEQTATTNSESEKSVEVGGMLKINLPDEFALLKLVPDLPHYLAIGPSPDETGNRRSAVMLFFTPAVDWSSRDKFNAQAKSRTERTMQAKGLTVKTQQVGRASDGIYRCDMVATNSKGVKIWWAVRCLFTKRYAVHAIVCSFTPQEFKTLVRNVESHTPLPTAQVAAEADKTLR